MLHMYLVFKLFSKQTTARYALFSKFSTQQLPKSMSNVVFEAFNEQQHIREINTTGFLHYLYDNYSFLISQFCRKHGSLPSTPIEGYASSFRLGVIKRLTNLSLLFSFLFSPSLLPHA